MEPSSILTVSTSTVESNFTKALFANVKTFCRSCKNNNRSKYVPSTLDTALY